IITKRGVDLKTAQAQAEGLRPLIDATERQIEATKRLNEDMTRAQGTEEKFGNANKAFEHAMRDLNREMATGRLSQAAYSRAVKETAEATQQAALEAKRYDDNLGSLAAGFEHAANANARANDMFSVGEKAFTSLTDAMGEGLDVLLGKS